MCVCVCVCVCACVHACVCLCVCVSGQYHQYCSAHDEWLIMKLCMYGRYHTANNVSNFGGDPVTQLNLINLKMLKQYDLPIKETPNNIHECSA